MLYADSDTVGRQPVLSPCVIVDTVLQLDALLNKLEQAVANVMKYIDNKKLVILYKYLLLFTCHTSRPDGSSDTHLYSPKSVAHSMNMDTQPVCGWSRRITRSRRLVWRGLTFALF